MRDPLGNCSKTEKLSEALNVQILWVASLPTVEELGLNIF